MISEKGYIDAPAKDNQPFFVYVPLGSPHTPPRAQLYNMKTDTGETINLSSKTPKSPSNSSNNSSPTSTQAEAPQEQSPRMTSPTNR